MTALDKFLAGVLETNKSGFDCGCPTASETVLKLLKIIDTIWESMEPEHREFVQDQLDEIVEKI